MYLYHISNRLLYITPNKKLIFNKIFLYIDLNIYDYEYIYIHNHIYYMTLRYIIK